MPTLYHSAAADKVLTIHGLDANPVYLPLYVELKMEEFLYTRRNSAALLSGIRGYAVCCIRLLIGRVQESPYSAEHIGIPDRWAKGRASWDPHLSSTKMRVTALVIGNSRYPSLNRNHGPAAENPVNSHVSRGVFVQERRGRGDLRGQSQEPAPPGELVFPRRPGIRR